VKEKDPAVSYDTTAYRLPSMVALIFRMSLASGSFEYTTATTIMGHAGERKKDRGVS